MSEEHYIFNDNRDYLNLISACVPLDQHDPSPSYTILSTIVSNLSNPGSVLDKSLVYNINEVIPDGEHKNNILNCAVTLYVNMYNELEAMRLNHAQTYYLISANNHVLIGCLYP